MEELVMEGDKMVSDYATEFTALPWTPEVQRKVFDALDELSGGCGFWLRRTTTAPYTVEDFERNQVEMVQKARNALGAIVGRKL